MLTEAFVFWNNAEQRKLSELNDKSKNILKTFFFAFFYGGHKKHVKIFGFALVIYL